MRVVIDRPSQICKGIGLKHKPVKVIVCVLNPATAYTVLEITVSRRRARSGRDGDVVDIQLGAGLAPPLDAHCPLLVLFERALRVDVRAQITPRSLASSLHRDLVAVLGLRLAGLLYANAQPGRFCAGKQIKGVNARPLTTCKMKALIKDNSVC